MKKTLLALVFVLVCLTSAARPVDPDVAARVAANFWNAHRDAGVAVLAGSMQMQKLPFDGMYLFTAGETGFVIVAADDRVCPILGYSFTSPVSEPLNPEVKYWLEGYQQQIDGLRSSSVEARHSDWETYGRATQGAPVPLTTVSPLLSTTWDQAPYYNDLCPYDANESSYYNYHVVTGCVATATAQIMKYHAHPSTGYGSHSYSHATYGLQSANFGSTTYSWSNMPNALTSSSSSTQKTAVATLMYHIGVADEMDYDLSANGGSGAQNYNYDGTISASSQTSLMKYFKYRPDMAVLWSDDYSESQYVSMLQDELDQSRPILYSGRNVSGGHSFVCDGYNNADQFHFNWGWGGSYDGYFTIGSLNPGVGGIGGNSSGTYNMRNSALVGIRPNTSWSTSGSTTVTASTVTGGSVSGTGSYSFGDTVSLVATASAGYRFDGWSDGSKFNPREFIANGGSYNFTPVFTSITADTVTYCTGDHYFYSYGSTYFSKYWGIKIPAASLPSGDSLHAVQIYISAAGTYTMTVYTGASQSNTAATSTVSFTSNDEGQWQTINLNTPVYTTEDLWIVFNCSNADYPVAVTYYSGAANSFLYGNSLSGMTDHGSYWQCTPMIKAVFGGGNSGSAPINDCFITTFPYVENFDDTSTYSCLWLIDGNGDGASWGIIDSFGTDYSRAAYIMYAVNADDWLLLPSIIDAGDYSISWKARAYQSNYPESYQVYAGDSMIFSETISTTSLVTRTASFSVAAGDTVKPKFRYISNDQYAFFLDDITISQTSGPSPTQYTLTVTSNNTAWGTVAGGGTYNSGATATLTATAYSGYHFVQWQDGNTGNPRTVTVTADATYTATFAANTTADTCTVSVFPYSEDFEGDIDCWTVTDGNNDNSTWRLLSGIGSGSTAVTPHGGSSMIGSFSWNSTAMNADEYLISPALELPTGSVSLTFWFRVNGGYPDDYLAVKLSTTGTSTTAFTTTLIDITPTSANGSWTQQTVDLSAYAGQTVYIAFHHHDSYDNNYIVLDDIAIGQSSGPSPTQYTLTVVSNNDAWGTVEGGGTYNSGATATLTATAYSGYHFVQWQDGNTDNPRTVTVTGNATYVATFAEDEQPSDCIVTDFPYAEGFEAIANLDCWFIYDADGDGYNWTYINDGSTAYGHASLAALGSASWNQTDGPLSPDNWLITPGFALPAGQQMHFKWYAKGQDETYCTENYGVYVSTSGTDASDFTTSLFYGSTDNTWTQHEVDLSAYAGQTVYLAFRHYNTTDMFYLMIDDVEVTASAPQPTQYTLTVVSNNDAWGTVEGGGTYNSGATATLTATAYSGYHFVQWNDGNTNATRTVTVTGNATYVATFASNEGIDDVDADQWVLYPNPAADVVTVSGVGHATVTVTDLTGRVVATAAVGTDGTMDVSMLASGTYFFTIASDGTTAVRKLIVKH